jgi:uncharacterized protein YodC (DUF2158 family)
LLVALAEMKKKSVYDGEVVYLESGSPPMIVIGGDDVDALCKWWDGECWKRESFPRACLVHIDPAWREPAEEK